MKLVVSTAVLSCNFLGKLTHWSLVLFGTTSHPLEAHVGPKECSSGYYLSVTASENGTLLNSCTQCHYSCQSCFGVGNTDCIECNDNYNKRDTYCVYVFFSSDHLFGESLVAVIIILIFMSIVFMCCFQTFFREHCCKKKLVSAEVAMQKSKLLEADEWETGLEMNDIIYEDQDQNPESALT